MAQDQTASMRGDAGDRLEELADPERCGFVPRKDSFPCGLERVTVYGTGGMPIKSGRGLFADALVTRFPGLPVEQEGRLNDPRLRETFIEPVFAYRRLAILFARRRSIRGRPVRSYSEWRHVPMRQRQVVLHWAYDARKIQEGIQHACPCDRRHRVHWPCADSAASA